MCRTWNRIMNARRGASLGRSSVVFCVVFHCKWNRMESNQCGTERRKSPCNERVSVSSDKNGLVWCWWTKEKRLERKKKRRVKWRRLTRHDLLNWRERSGGSLFVNLDYILSLFISLNTCIQQILEIRFRRHRRRLFFSHIIYSFSLIHPLSLSLSLFASLYFEPCKAVSYRRRWLPLPGTFFIDTLDIKSDIVEYFLSRLLDARVCRRKEEKEKELKKKKLFSLVFILAHKLAEESDCASLYYKPNAGDMMAVFLVLWPTRLQVF